MKSPLSVFLCAAALSTFGVSLADVHAASILILTGSGTSNLDAPLAGAGFTVVNGTLAPGQLV